MAEFTRDMLFGSKYSNNSQEKTTDIVDVKPQVADVTNFSLDTITSEILTLKDNIAINIIEIGKRLNTVKENVQYGEFGKWLEEKVAFSQRTANNFMKIAKEFPDSQQVANLGTRKLLLLADVDFEEREELMKENNITDITAEELKKAIQDKKGNIPKEKSQTKFTGKIKKDTLKKYKDRFSTNDDFDELIDKLLSEYFENH